MTLVRVPIPDEYWVNISGEVVFVLTIFEDLGEDWVEFIYPNTDRKGNWKLVEFLERFRPMDTAG